MTTRIYCAVEQDGALVGDFALVADVDLLGDVDALKQCIKEPRSRLRDVELGDMTVFGVWPSAAAVPEAVGNATKGRGLAPNVKLSSLISATGDYFSIVLITAPPPAAAAGASVLGWHDSWRSL